MSIDKTLLAQIIGNDPHKQEYEKLVKNKTVDHVSLGSLVLTVGFIRDTNFIARINEKCGKGAKYCKVNVGECLAVMLLMLAAGRYNSLSQCALDAKELPLISLLDLDSSISLSDFSRHVMGRALAIFRQEALTFFNEFAMDVYYKYGLALVIEVHVDSTSMYFYKIDDDGHKELMTTEEVEQLQKELPLDQFNAAVAGSRAALEAAQQEIDTCNPSDAATEAQEEQQTNNQHKVIRILRGHSKDHRSDLGQIVICSVVEGVQGIPLFSKVADGNSSDKTLFAEVAQESLALLKERFADLKYWVSDSAGCTRASLDAVAAHNVYSVTRATDNLLFTQDIFKKIQENPSLLQDFLDEAGRWEYEKRNGKEAGLPTAFISKGTLFDRDVIALAISNPALAKTKKATETKKAEKERDKIIKALNRRYKCEEDAKTQAKKVKSKAIYCDVELGDYDGRVVNAKPGPLPKDPAKQQTKLVDVKVMAKVTISQNKLNQAIERECCYVIVTTDTKREWTALDLYNIYKRNHHIETLWRMQKNHSQFLNRFFLQNNERIEGLAFLLSLGGLAHTVMQAVIRKKVAEGSLLLPNDEGTQYDPKPTMKRICNHFDKASVSISLINHGGHTWIEVTNVDSFVFSVLASLGSSWLNLIRSDIYYEHEVLLLISQKKAK